MQLTGRLGNSAVGLSIAFAAVAQGQTLITTTTTYDAQIVTLPTGTLDINGSGSPTLFLLNGSTLNSGITTLTIGNTQSGALNLSGGSMMTNSENAHLGFSNGATGAATIGGANSQWTLSNHLYVGYSGQGTLTITDGGRVAVMTQVGHYGYLGYNASGVGTAIVSGANSLWTMSNSLYAGHEGQGTLTVTDGGRIISSGSYLGTYLGSSGSATISGLNSLWTLTRDSFGALYVGLYGQGSLTIAASGRVVTAGQGYLGYETSGVGAALITDPNSQWTGSGILVSGYMGQGTLTIANGGRAASTEGYLGFFSTGTGTATISGASSQWTMTNDLTVGRDGTGSLAITGGGVATSAFGYLGRNLNATGTLLISGAGSQWTLTNHLYVGNSGRGTLTIADGGRVSISNSGYYGYLGYNQSGIGSAVVTGANSQWTMSNSFFVGHEGQGTLTIADGGSVTSDQSSIGTYLTSTGTAMITGANSLWSLSGFASLNVGLFGQGTLTIADGGRVQPGGNGYLGYEASGIGNATITGANSLWTMPGSLVVGLFGQGTLTIADGGRAVSEVGFIGLSTTGSGTATITGVGSQWTLTNDLYVGGTSVAANGAGTLDVAAGGVLNVGGLTKIWRDGELQIAAGGNLQTTTLQIASGGVGQLAAGGTLDAAGALTVVGSANVSNSTNVAGLLVVDGNLSAASVSIGQGGLLQGNGVIDAPVAIQSGGGLSPGNSVGALTVSNGLTLSGGANLYFEFRDAPGTMDFNGGDPGGTGAGYGWDHIDLGASLLDLGNASSGNPIYIYLRAWSLNNSTHADDAGDTNFNPLNSYDWLFIRSTNMTLPDFDFPPDDSLARRFALIDDLAGAGVFGTGNAFTRPQSSAGQGTFRVAFGDFGQGTGMYIRYSAIPEPSSLLLASTAIAGYLARRRRARRASQIANSRR